MSPKIATILGATAVVALSLKLEVPKADAGFKITYPVFVAKYTAGGGYAYGTFGDARSSTDTSATLMCTVTAGSGAPSATCLARSNGQLAMCVTTDPDHIQVLTTISDSSYIQFHWDADSSNCTSVSVTSSSGYAPRQL